MRSLFGLRAMLVDTGDSDDDILLCKPALASSSRKRSRSGSRLEAVEQSAISLQRKGGDGEEKLRLLACGSAPVRVLSSVGTPTNQKLRKVESKLTEREESNKAERKESKALCSRSKAGGQRQTQPSLDQFFTKMSHKVAKE